MFLMNIFVRERKGIWMILCVRVSVCVWVQGARGWKEYRCPNAGTFIYI